MNTKAELEALYQSAKANGDLRLAFDILVFYAGNHLRINIGTNPNPIHLKDAISNQKVPEGYIWDYVGSSNIKQS